jgi:hypothetical protein
MNKLIFVYNAGSGYWNLALDIAHKVFSPATYPCHLCDLTYGVLKIRPEWQQFLDSAQTPMEFLHQDEFVQTWPAWQHLALPAILEADASGALQLKMDQAALNALPDVQALVRAIRAIEGFL